MTAFISIYGWRMLAAKVVSVCLVVIVLVLAIAINRAVEVPEQTDFSVTLLEGQTSMVGPFSVLLKRVDRTERPLVELEISSPDEKTEKVSLAPGESARLARDWQIQSERIGFGIARFRFQKLR